MRKSVKRNSSRHDTILSALSACSPLGYCAVDGHTGAVLYVNRRFGELWSLDPRDTPSRAAGWRHDELHAACLARLKRPATLPALFPTVPDGDDHGTAESDFELTDGRVLRRRAGPLRDDDGACCGWLCVFEDVTVCRQTEERLRESEECYRLLAENTTHLISRHGLDSVCRYVSPSCVNLLGWHPDELLGRTPAAVLHPQDWKRLRRAYRRPADAPETQVLSLRLRRKDGSVAWVESSVRRLRHPQTGVPHEFVVVTRDISERQRLEQQYLQAQKMEAIGRLAGGVAHDFNNLLTVILGFSNILLEDPALPAVCREMVGQIQQGGERAAALTKQLLAFSRKQLLNPVALDLNEVVAGLAPLLRRLIGEDIALGTDFDAEVYHVKADRGQLEQVLMNLAVNARDAMPKGGRLTLGTSRAQLDWTFLGGRVAIQPGPYVLLTVSDNGSGMDEAVKARLFEPFFTTKELGKGTGLGLATVYGIVKQSGGYIDAASEPGRGSTFSIYLPRVSEPPPAAARLGLPDSPRGTETVLLVEDEDAVRDLTRRVLALQGYTVLEAHHGRAALELSANHPGLIDLLVTNVVMPEMNGRQLADRLTQLRPGIKVLFVSGYTEGTAVHQGVLEPGRAFLQKPLTPQSLARKVRATLDGH